MLIRREIGNFVHKLFATRASLLWPGLGISLPRYHNVLILREGPHGRELLPAANLVTDAGDRHYAQLIAGETPANSFNTLYLSSVDWAATHPQKATTSENIASVIAGASKAVAATYPKTDDDDVDNSGAGVDVVTWQFNFAKADFADGDIDAGAIGAAGIGTWGAAPAQSLLTAFDIVPSFSKTADDTLKVIVNHTMNGV